MENKIGVGEYIRTKKGNIDKLEAILGYEDDEVEAIAKCEKSKYWLEDIIKHSKNIIDLIEEGDYVNEKKIIEVRKQDNKIHLMTSYCPQEYIREDIKSIVTKEQFESRKYEVN